MSFRHAYTSGGCASICLPSSYPRPTLDLAAGRDWDSYCTTTECTTRRAKITAEAQQQLGRFGERLLPREEQLAYTLSYANRRRTEIARGLALRPCLLLLDEPTAGMNPTETAEVLEQLLELRAEGQTILLVEHKLDLVMKLSDHVLVMDGGELIAQGSPDVVQEDERVIEAYIGRRRSYVS